MSKIFKKISEAVEEGELEDIVLLTQEALDDEESPQDIMNLGLIAGMNIVGELFRDGDLYVPDVLIAAKTMDAGMEVIKPFLKVGEIKKSGKVVFCTVLGDLHDIGKKLCVMLMEGAGYEVIDIGVDVGADQIVEAVKEHKPDIVAMSAMLTTTMVTMEDAVQALRDHNLLDQVCIMVGGAPVSAKFAQSIGGNYSEDAIAAVALADQLMKA
ncbi:MAG: corrinoid protein [Anaerovorax sp.]